MARKPKEKMENMLNPLEEEFPSNSKASRTAPIRPTQANNDNVVEDTDEPKVERVRKPRIIRRKKSILATMFGNEVKEVAQYVLFDVLIPAAKTTIQEMVTQGIEMFLFGEAGRGRSRSRDRGETRISYSNMYKRRDEAPRTVRSPRGNKFGLDEIIFERGDEASDVLEQMCEQLETYDQVSVADFYDLADVEGAHWTFSKWGWTDLSQARCTHTRGGYMILFPPPKELD